MHLSPVKTYCGDCGDKEEGRIEGDVAGASLERQCDLCGAIQYNVDVHGFAQLAINNLLLCSSLHVKQNNCEYTQQTISRRLCELMCMLSGSGCAIGVRYTLKKRANTLKED